MRSTSSFLPGLEAGKVVTRCANDVGSSDLLASWMVLPSTCMAAS